MTKDEAYLYAKKIRRLNLTHIELENKMKREGYSDDSINTVKYWLSHKPVGV